MQLQFLSLASPISSAPSPHGAGSHMAGAHTKHFHPPKFSWAGLLSLVLARGKFCPSWWPWHALSTMPGVPFPHLFPRLDLDISFDVTSLERPSLDTRSKEATSRLFLITGTKPSLPRISHGLLLFLFICVCLLPGAPMPLSPKCTCVTRGLVHLAHLHIPAPPL